MGHNLAGSSSNGTWASKTGDTFPSLNSWYHPRLSTMLHLNSGDQESSQIWPHSVFGCPTGVEKTKGGANGSNFPPRANLSPLP